ncbi:ABC transporter [Cnuibacter physcomitrellae]|uniref:Iron-dicitrate transporter ATP-binding subunit n=1 Tax=Cnuibacter physcomitrellae TaxID=1619308 RepID=A0A1X9LF73_9MICO|nr:ABC transporter ATP-binding protein [Cnuibacter physcomitrellae]ARJ03844.1 iron-dicitrate transporter ATP-binding subunit [Cnuibacter physcomitrellae]GGI39634.1 ABC transporter [Cnuibacter physcomitrellae]
MSAPPGLSRLVAEGVTLGYGDAPVVSELSVAVPPGSFTVIIGPNACGKSTLLRALSRLLAPTAGRVVLDGRTISAHPAKEVARRLGLLPQSALAPDGITVADLVARGRYPHQSLLRQWSNADEVAVREALEATGTTELATRPVDALSGGQRQRVWVAMVLAQQTDLLLLDEPTTFLDIAHQVELMELFADLHTRGRTIVAVLHDLNHAARYADHVVAMRDGRIVAQGSPREVITTERVEEVYGLPNVVIDDPVTGGPLVVPLRGGARVAGAGT